MVNFGQPNTNNSQFYITLAPAPHLDGRYTVCGRVTSGLHDVVSGPKSIVRTVKVDSNNDCPLGDGITVADCGVLTETRD